MVHGKRASILLLALGALGAGANTAQAQAPNRGAAGEDLVTLNVYGGGYAPMSSLAPGADFGDSGTIGAAATLWVHEYVGVRANGLYAQTDASGAAPAPLGNEKPDVWAYSGDLVLRLPLSADGGRTWFPYVVGGVGGKTYDFKDSDAETDFAGNFGGGIEYRFTRVGLQAEVRDIISTFDRFGVEETQHDVAWTAGITMSF